MEKWFVTAKGADFAAWSRELGITQVAARVIRNRDNKTLEEAALFLNGSLGDCYSPRLLLHMDEAVQFIHQAIEEQMRIRIIGDYDVDGIASAYILTKGLQAMGARADTVIPHRIHDGYGLSDQLIDTAYEDGIGMLITCDNGIAAHDQVSRAVALGIRVIITDHHEVPFTMEGGERREILPPAMAIVDPKQDGCSYPYPNICGAAVTYKVVQALAASRAGNVWQKIRDELLEFAALATVCDVMELRDENRILVKEGLKRLRHTKNKGLRALMMVNDLDMERLSVYHLGFVLGPCLNATGRLDSAQRALELINCEDEREAYVLAAGLKELNDSRKNLTKEGVEGAEAYIESRQIGKDPVLVIYLPQVHESLAGIIAGKIREKYNRPVLVLTRGQDEIKGSGRSVEAYSMYEELSKISGFFSKYGGHKLAAGFSLKSCEELCREGLLEQEGRICAAESNQYANVAVKKNHTCGDKSALVGDNYIIEEVLILREEAVVEALRQALKQSCTLSEDDFYQKVLIDMQMPLSYATMELAEELERLEPFGTGNPKPLFVQKDVHFRKGFRIGAKQTFARFRVESSEGTEQELLYFGDLEQFLRYLTEKFGDDADQKIFQGNVDYAISVTYQISINRYKGRDSLQFVMQNYS
jgi:single-stranded-DNA-specific exonuclease